MDQQDILKEILDYIHDDRRSRDFCEAIEKAMHGGHKVTFGKTENGWLSCDISNDQGSIFAIDFPCIRRWFTQRITSTNE